MGANKEENKNENIDSIQQDLTELIHEIRKFNKYMDIFFTANGVYEQAAEAILIRRLSDVAEKKDVMFRGTVM